MQAKAAVISESLRNPPRFAPRVVQLKQNRPSHLARLSALSATCTAVIKAIEHDPFVFRRLHLYSNQCQYLQCQYFDIINNPTVALIAVMADAGSFCCIADALKNDYEITLEAMKRNGMMLEYAGYDMRRNECIIQAAIKQNPAAAAYAVRDTRDDLLLAAPGDGDASPDRRARSRSVSPNRQPLLRTFCRTCFEMVGNMQIKLRVRDGVTVCAYCNTSVALPNARNPLTDGKKSPDDFLWARSTKDTQGANEVAEEGKEQVPRG